ncbi:MAG: alpha-amylase family glycosyl hydrolase, partial [Terrimesophilobacter sp.]
MPSVDPLHSLGARLTEHGGEVRVYSASATAMELCLFSLKDPDWIANTIPFERDEHNVWFAASPQLVAGRNYTVRANGPSGPLDPLPGVGRFDAQLHLIDPYSRGLTRTPTGQWRSCILDDEFDWAGTTKPATPVDHTVIYEVHAKGFTKLNPAVPEELRGSYAGFAHESTINYLHELGVSAVELLPVHQFVTEQRLVNMGLHNYWGYNSLNFFAPHARWASKAAQHSGPAAVVREFKGMVRLLHEAGIEVILDVVYNHT